MRINDSAECSKNELDLFNVPPTQTSIEEGFYDDIPAHSNFDKSSTIRFDITGDSLHFLNLSETEIHIKGYFCSLADPNNGILETKKIGIANNLLGSLFSSAEISLNNKPVENTNSLMHYRDYIYKTLGLSAQEKNSQLVGSLYFKDSPGKVNNFTLNAGNNVGWNTRRLMISTKKIIQLQGKLSCDIFNINHLMVSSVGLQIKLTKSSPKFYMLGEEEVADFHFNFTEVFLRIKRNVISPSVREAISLTSEISPFKYPLSRVVLKPFVISYASTKFTIRNLCDGILPKRIILGFLQTSAFDGAYAEDPYDFKNIGLLSLLLKVNSKSLPVTEGLKLDYDKNTFLDGYRSISKLNKDLDLSLEEYKSNFCFYAFDLNPDSGSCNHYSSLKDGQIDLDVTLKASLTASHTLIAVLEYSNVIDISKTRQANFDYLV
jgi:hypothetical protein